jgi:hypothetical protein
MRFCDKKIERGAQFVREHQTSDDEQRDHHVLAQTKHNKSQQFDLIIARK